MLVFTACQSESELDSPPTQLTKSDDLSKLAVSLNGVDGLTAQALDELLRSKFDVPQVFAAEDLGNFEVITSKDEEGLAYKWLLCSNVKGEAKQDFGLELGTLTGTSKLAISGGSKTCTCKGCSNGCELSVNGDICSCSPCQLSSSSECKKKESITVFLL